MPDREHQRERNLQSRRGLATRYLLDTNVWRYVVDAGEEDRLVSLASSPSLSIQISPATVNETLRLKNVALMRRIVRLQTKPCFERLLAEAFLMGAELILEITRLHPEWLRSPPDHRHFKKWFVFWKDRWWRRVRSSPDNEAKHLRVVEGDLLDRVREIAAQKRNVLRETGPSHNRLPLDSWYAQVPRPFPGWRGFNRVEAWRITTLIAITNNLTSHENGMRPILESCVDFSNGLLASEAWQVFWLYEAEKGNLVRFYLEWLHDFSAQFRKTTPGTPGDTQLFSYLPETDVFVSADKGIVQIIEEVRPYSPVELPRTLLIKGGREGVELLLSQLSSASSPT